MSRYFVFRTKVHNKFKYTVANVVSEVFIKDKSIVLSASEVGQTDSYFDGLFEQYRDIKIVSIRYPYI